MMSPTAGLTAIDMRVQPSWRWTDNDEPPQRAARLTG